MQIRREIMLAVLFVGACLIPGTASAHATTADTQWHTAVTRSVDSDPTLATLAPSDITDFCPAYANLDATARVSFWEQFFVQLAQAESGGHVERSRWRPYDPTMGRPTFRRGLFQISIEAARSARYQCNDASATALQSPQANAECALRIFTNDVATSGAIGSGEVYWPTLRSAARRRRFGAALASSAPCART